MTLHLSDLLKYRSGPFWDAYQRERAREHITEDPDYVPEWFLYRTLMNRFSVARTALEPFARGDQTIMEGCSALHHLGKMMRGSNRVGQIELLTAAMFGVAEIEEERERQVLSPVIEIAFDHRPLRDALRKALELPEDADDAQIVVAAATAWQAAKIAEQRSAEEGER